MGTFIPIYQTPRGVHTIFLKDLIRNMYLLTGSSGMKELHLQALTEPCWTVSRHTAPIFPTLPTLAFTAEVISNEQIALDCSLQPF